MKLSKAREFEKEKNLPKFDHANMAVINPIPKKRKMPPPEPDYSQTLLIASKQAGMNVRGVSQKQLPEHLIRPPIDVLLEPLPKPRKFNDSPEKGLNMSNTDKKKAKEEEKKREE